MNEMEQKFLTEGQKLAYLKGIIDTILNITDDSVIHGELSDEGRKIRAILCVADEKIFKQNY